VTNLQLFIAVVIPSALMVVNLLSVYRLEGRLDSRLDRISNRMDRFDGRMDQLAKEVSDIRVALADLRTELYEKFQPKAHA